MSEVIKAGEKLRLSKKKANMVSKKQETNRDWGKVGFGVWVGTAGWGVRAVAGLSAGSPPPRAWHVLDVRRCAPLSPPITLGPSPGYQWDLCGSSVSK